MVFVHDARENGICCSLVNVFHPNIWFSLLSVCCFLFVSTGIIIVMSSREGIGYAGVWMRALVSESAHVYDLLLLCVLSFKMIITTRMIRKRFC